MISASQVKPHMPVVCCKGGAFAVVDHMEGQECIKLQKDDSGQHHYIPLSWVISTENGRLKVDRSGDQALTDWSDQAPANIRH